MAQRDAMHRAAALLVEAGLDPACWPAALDAMASACGARSGQLISLDKAGAITSHWLTKVPEGFTREVEAFGLANPVINPRVRIGATAKIMTPVADQDYVDASTRSRLPIYAEMFEPYDLAFNCQAVLLRDEARLVRTSITRTKKEGALDGASRSAFAALLPYVQAAVRMQAALEQARISSMLLTLNAISAPAFLLDGAGRVVGVSAAGEQLAREQETVRVAKGRLEPVMEHERKSFEAQLAAACEAARGGVGALVGPLIASHAGAEGGIVFDVQPLPLARGMFGDGPAVLVIARAAGAKRDSAGVLVRLFHLTEAEAAVAVLLADGQSLAEIAEARGVARDTVRTQIRGVFAKMGVGRQAELVAAVRRLG